MPIKPRRAPKKFRRPSIDLDHHGKAWRDMAANELRVGDILLGAGLINKIISDSHPDTIFVYAGQDPMPRVFVYDQSVRAFGPRR